MDNVIDFINVNRDRYLDELKAFLAIPSISALPQHASDVRRAAEWTAEELRRVGLQNVRLIETPGNPGQSITNCVEELCFQVCERFDIPADRLVWLEHYDFLTPDEWNMVTFAQYPPNGPFSDPHWTPMTPETWRDLRLRPKRKLRPQHSSFDSKVVKLFHWPTEAIL